MTQLFMHCVNAGENRYDDDDDDDDDDTNHGNSTQV